LVQLRENNMVRNKTPRKERERERERESEKETSPPLPWNPPLPVLS
jgi:hypothetical protein